MSRTQVNTISPLLTLCVYCPLSAVSEGGGGEGGLCQDGHQGHGGLSAHVQVSPSVPEDGAHHGDPGGLPHHLQAGRLLAAEL